MEFKDFTAGIDDNGRRIDKILRKFCKDMPMSSIYSAIRKGLIKVNHKKSKAENKLDAGDVISIAAFLLESPQNQSSPAEKNSCVTFDSVELTDVFINDNIRIISKPYDISSQSSKPGELSLDKIIKEEYKKNSNNASLSFEPGPLHRLDKKTTGLLAFSQSLVGAQWFTKAISDKTIRKIYVGLCQGDLIKEETWQNNLETATAFDSKDFHKMKITEKGNNTAITHVIPLCQGTYKTGNLSIPVTLCQYEILTGLKHQIRLQSSFNRHPLLGDTAYGGQKIKEDQDFYLHAACLVIPEDNPVDLPEKIICPVNQFFDKILKKSLINWNGDLII